MTHFAQMQPGGRLGATVYVQMPDMPMFSTSVSSIKHIFQLQMVRSPISDRLLLLSDSYLGLVSTSGSALLQLDRDCRGRAAFSPDGQLLVAMYGAHQAEHSSRVGAGGDQACLGVYRARDGALVFTKAWDGSASPWQLMFSSEGSKLYLSNTSALHVLHFGPEVGGCDSIQLCNAVAGARKQLVPWCHMPRVLPDSAAQQDQI